MSHVNQGKHSLTLNSWAGMWLIREQFAQLCHNAQFCHGQGLWGAALQPSSTHVAWDFMLPLAWRCAQPGQCTAKILQPLSFPADRPALKEASVVSAINTMNSSLFRHQAETGLRSASEMKELANNSGYMGSQIKRFDSPLFSPPLFLT